MVRRACDGAGLLGGLPGGGRQPRGARRRDQRPQRLSRSRTATRARTCSPPSRRRSRRPRRSPGQPADRIAAAISFGALMGARGNSGVITSQIFRGMAEGLGGKRRFNGLDLAHALSEGAKTAYGAVAKPVEGTILTVIRESAAAAVAAAERDNDIESRPGGDRSMRAEKSVARTPSLLRDPARGGRRRLGRAGPVPAVPGRAAPPRRASRRRPRAAAGRRPGPEAVDAGGPRRRGLRLRDDVPAPAEWRGPARRRRRSATTSSRIGESVLVAGDARALKVHVHNERPDLVIGYGLTRSAP